MLCLVRVCNVVKQTVSQFETVRPVFLVVPQRYVFGQPPHPFGVRVVHLVTLDAEDIWLRNSCPDQHHLLLNFDLRRLKVLASSVGVNLLKCRLLVILKHQLTSPLEGLFVLMVREYIARGHDGHRDHLHHLLALLGVDESSGLNLIAINSACAEDPHKPKVDPVNLLKDPHTIVSVKEKQLVLVDEIYKLDNILLWVKVSKH